MLPNPALFPNPLSGSTICVWWPNLGSVAFACTIGMIGKTRKSMSTTKCACAVIHTEKEDVLTQARAQQVSQAPVAAERFFYAFGKEGQRAIFLVFDMADTSQIPVLSHSTLPSTSSMSG